MLGTLRQCFATVAVFTLSACASQRAPIAPGVVPTQQSSEITASDIRYGEQVLQAFKSQFPISHDAQTLVRLREVVEKLADGAGAGGSGWQIYLFEGDSILNAAATRGNFIFVWTGLVKKVEDDAELATALAHEMGHVLARHTYQTPEEQVNQAISGIAGAATQGVLASNAHAALARLGASLVQQIVAAAIINPESQRLELEADQIGLFIMAQAHYNPEKAVSFWRKLASSEKFEGMSLNFLSTHPSSEERINQLESLLPQAMDVYHGRRRPSASSLSSPPSRRSQEEWEVLEDWTELYAEPNRRSKALGKLFYQERFKAERRGAWLEVLSPRAGFVRSRDCAPVR